MSLGRLLMPADLAAFLLEQIAIKRFEVLQIGLSHALAVYQLPHHHRDPFDRMLAAQAKIERLPLVSGDGRFDACGIERICRVAGPSSARLARPPLSPGEEPGEGLNLAISHLARSIRRETTCVEC